MKKILLATALAFGVLTFTMAGSNHSTAPTGNLTKDTVPEDTTQPAPTDTTKVQ